MLSLKKKNIVSSGNVMENKYFLSSPLFISTEFARISILLEEITCESLFGDKGLSCCGCICRVLDTSEQESLKIQKQKRAALAKLER